MISVLGLPLHLAKARLEADGFGVDTREVRSKKGLDGNDLRVIAVKQTGKERVLLEYALFITDVLDK